MSNELNNILSIHTDGVYEGVAIGGDRYPVSTFIDHLLRYQVFSLTCNTHFSFVYFEIELYRIYVEY